MARVINTDSTAKQRNQLLRTAAEILRHLSQKPDLDDAAKDMLATLVYCFREIDAGIDQSTVAWEKRNYWMKAEKLRQRWDWVNAAAHRIQKMLYNEDWQQLPEILVKLIPHFASIKVTRFTRDASAWEGSYQRLLQENSD